MLLRIQVAGLFHRVRQLIGSKSPYSFSVTTYFVMQSSPRARYDAYNSVFNTSTQVVVGNHISCNGAITKPCINVGSVANMVYERGTWIAYKRNYFATECSFSLPFCDPGTKLYVGRNMSRVLSFGVTLSSFSDRKTNIELLEFTAKRDISSACTVGIHVVIPTCSSSLRRFPDNNNTGDTPNNVFHLTSPYKCLGTSTNTNTTSYYFERIQFKNSSFKRSRSKLTDETYRISVDLYAQIQCAEDSEPRWIRVAYKVSEPIVVRGKSPKNFLCT